MSDQSETARAEWAAAGILRESFPALAAHGTAVVTYDQVANLLAVAYLKGVQSGLENGVRAIDRLISGAS